MRCTIVGHSTLFVETSGPTILIDPWLVGSCYWRSWWHFPPTGDIDPRWLAPDYLYVSHDHFDHFHYPSVRRLDRTTQVLVPRFGVDFMRGEFRRLGFENLTELSHGRVVSLAPHVQIASYQYGFDDSVLVVRDGGSTIIDFNDCKVRGRALRNIARRWGGPDLMLKSHSFAQGYPNCYEADDPQDLGRVSERTYLDDFFDTADIVRPRHAIPFASMVAFLHPESRDCNQFLVTPEDVRRASLEDARAPGTEVVTMAPGDRWDSASGFDRSEEDWYTDREHHLDELAAIAEPKIARSDHEEAQRTLSFTEFRDFFEPFLRALPRLLTRFVLRRPIAFFIHGDDRPYWVLDVRTRRVRAEPAPPSDVAAIITVQPGLLADAIVNKIVHYIHISMRFRTRLAGGGVDDDLVFWALLGMWELGYLPLRTLLRPRMARVAWRRRAELAQVARAALSRRGTFADRMSGQLAARE